MEQRHTVAELFVIHWETKDGKTGEYDWHTNGDDATSRAENLRVSETALLTGTKYGVTKHTTITLEEVVLPLKAAGWKKMEGVE